MSRRLCAFTFVLRRGDESREATFYARDEAAARGYARTWAVERGWSVEGCST